MWLLAKYFVTQKAIIPGSLRYKRVMSCTAGAGMAASDVVKRKVASLGMGMVEPQQGMAALERLLAVPATLALARAPVSLPAVVPVVPFNWERLLSRPLQV